ncbi:FAD/NAD(P)-binding domain-containing protein, partial [Jaminaea rosea]
MHILVSGAGIAGSTLAWWLARTGIRVTLIERDPSSVGKGHNIDVQGSALSILERMSLLDTLKANNTGERGTTVIDQHGKTLASFPLETGLSPTNPHEILRGDLCGLLHAAAMKQSGVQTVVGRIDPGSVLVNEKGVTASLHDGRPLSGDALVICDGQWSHLRSHLYDPSDITVVDKNFFSFYATIPREEQDGDQWWLCSVDRRRMLTTRPDPHGSTRAMLLKVPCDAREKESLEAASRAPIAHQKALARTLFSSTGWQAKRLCDGIDKSDDFYLHNVKQIRMARWVTQDRIICLGDTAYCPTPLTGMGAPLAILGAYTLAGELSILEDDATRIPQAFSRYEKIYREHVEKAQEIPLGSLLPGIALPSSWLGVTVLRTFLACLARLCSTPWIADRLRGDGK